jgi:hypothetical protein
VSTVRGEKNGVWLFPAELTTKQERGQGWTILCKTHMETRAPSGPKEVADATKQWEPLRNDLAAMATRTAKLLEWLEIMREVRQLESEEGGVWDGGVYRIPAKEG